VHTIVWIPMVFSAIAAAAVVSALSKREVPADEADAGGVLQQLRAQALFARADSIGIRPASGAAWAVIMDSAYEGGCVSLVSLADGSTSIYFSTGGGIIGAGDRKTVAAASIAFVRAADSALDLLRPAESTDHPPAGYSRFFVRTDSALLSADALEPELGEGAHALSPLFYAAQDVIAAVRDSEVGTGANLPRPRAVDRR
jgi:hypothetical protein